jgi:predicted PurR-regulated permease PerM
MSELKIEIKLKTILLIFSIVVGTFLIFSLRGILIFFLLAFILSAGLRPIVNRLEDYRIPRSLAILLIYLLLIVFIIVLTVATLDAVISQAQAFIVQLPDIVRNIIDFLNKNIPATREILNKDEIINDVRESIRSYSNISNLDIREALSIILETLNIVGIQGFTLVSSVVGGIFSLFIIIMTSVYMVSQRSREFYKGVFFLSKEDKKDRYIDLAVKVENGVGRWFGGQLLLMLLIGMSTYIILTIPKILGVDNYSIYQFAILIALLAGILEGVPNIGPIITAIIVMIFGIGTSSSASVLAYLIIAFTLLQQLEGIIIVPIVMRRAVGIEPVVSIFAIISGLKLAGIAGAILSIPLVVSVKILLREITFKESEEPETVPPNKLKDLKLFRIFKRNKQSKVTTKI